MCLLAFAVFWGLAEHPIHTHDDEYFADAQASQGDFSYVFSSERINPGRPTFNLYLWAAYRLFGSSPRAFHILQVSLHLFASVLFALTAHRLGAPLSSSLAAGLLFLVSISHYRAVHWISCTAYVVALICSLSTLLLYHRYVRTAQHWWRAASVLAYLAAVLSHGSTVVLAAPCALLEWQQGRSLRRALGSVIPFLVTGILWQVGTPVRDGCV